MIEFFENLVNTDFELLDVDSREGLGGITGHIVIQLLHERQTFFLVQDAITIGVEFN